MENKGQYATFDLYGDTLGGLASRLTDKVLEQTLMHQCMLVFVP